MGDSFGDGLCCSDGSGKYSVHYNDDKVGGGGNFQDKEVTEIGCTSLEQIKDSEGLALQEEPGRFDDLVKTIADSVADVIPEPGGAIVGALLEVLLPFIFEWTLGLLLDLAPGRFWHS